MMLRAAPLVACFSVLAGMPAQAWEFSPSPICTLSHEEAGASVRITHDPRETQAYAITVRNPASWPSGPVFAMRFEGGAGRTIFTDRHRMLDDGGAVHVTDSGFGNLLDGLESNARVTAMLGESTLAFSLAGAAEPVQRFRACAMAPTA